MESESKKSLSKLDRWSQIFTYIGLFLTPLLFWPVFGLSLEAFKKIAFAGAVAIALVLWFSARLKTKTLSVPRTHFWTLAGLFGLIAIVSAAVSGSARSAFLGLGVESGSVFSLLLFFGLAFLITEFSLSKQKFLKVYLGLFGVFALAFLFQVLRLLFGNFLHLPFYDLAAANIIGKWNDLGLLAGLVALSATIILEYFPLKQAKLLKVSVWTSLVISLITAALVNFYQLWLVLAAFSLLLYILNLTVLGKRETKRTYWRLSLFLFIFAAVFSVLATPISYDAQGKAHEGILSKQVRQLSEKLKIASLEVRPSWRGTYLVANAALKKDVFFGVGPNHFQQAWLSYKPTGVNDSQFWNIEPDFAVGFLPTFVITTGLLGGAAIFGLLVLILMAGFKALLSPKYDALDKSFLLLSFIGTAYGWVLLSIYVPQTSILVIIFGLTGLFLGRLVDLGFYKKISLALAGDPKTRFVSAISSVGAGVVLVLLAYAWVAAVGAIVLTQRAGTIMQKKNDPDAALKMANRAIMLNPQDLYYRTAAQLNLSQMGALINKKLPQEQLMGEYSKIFALAKNNVDAAVAAAPANYQNYVARGSLYENIMALGVSGSYDLAKKNYADAAGKNPFGPDMQLNLARLEVANLNYQGAEKYLEEALKLKKDYVDAIFLQSQLYAERGYLDSAVARLQYAAQLAPNDPGVLFQLGYMKYRNADYRGASEALSAAVSLVPNYANALYFLGLSLDKLGQTNKAIEAFSVIEQSNPGNTEVNAILANLRTGRSALAEAPAPEAKTPAKK